MLYKEIKKCRICGNTNLVSVVNLGRQALTGVFPKSIDEEVPVAPLELVKCHPVTSEHDCCHLLQLKHSFEKEEMYGHNYGYRSGLNTSMVSHLDDISNIAMGSVDLISGDCMIDIGSNDGTLLRAFPHDFRLIGVDPTGEKFMRHYSPFTELVSDFFSRDLIKNRCGDIKAKIITSIAMFYDLEDPFSFMRDVYDTLADDGVWLMEQSYMPAMIDNNLYDTICHEHFEYYGLYQIKWMADNLGFTIIDVRFNDINGGSFLVVLSKKQNAKELSLVGNILNMEKRFLGLHCYQKFKTSMTNHRMDLVNLIRDLKAKGKTIAGYGASTKGNVLLQFCNFNQKDIHYIVEVNEDKFGCFTPGTNIPIIPDELLPFPDYMLMLPWHFRDNIIEKEQEYLKNGGKFIFPLPKIEIVGG